MQLKFYKEIIAISDEEQSHSASMQRSLSTTSWLTHILSQTNKDTPIPWGIRSVPPKWKISSFTLKFTAPDSNYSSAEFCCFKMFFLVCMLVSMRRKFIIWGHQSTLRLWSLASIASDSLSRYDTSHPTSYNRFSFGWANCFVLPLKMMKCIRTGIELFWTKQIEILSDAFSLIQRKR